MARYPVPPRVAAPKPHRASLPATPQTCRATEPARRYSSPARRPRWVQHPTARAALAVALAAGARGSFERPPCAPDQRNFGTCTRRVFPLRRRRRGQVDSEKQSPESSSSHPARSTANIAGKNSALALAAALAAAVALALPLAAVLGL